MGFIIKIALVALLLFSAVSVIISSGALVYPNQRYSKFNENQIKYIRFIISDAEEKSWFIKDRPLDVLLCYVYMDLNATFPGPWNMVTYHKDDWKTNFFWTEMNDENILNSRFYQIVDGGSGIFKYSLIILQTKYPKVDQSTYQLQEKKGEPRSLVPNQKQYFVDYSVYLNDAFVSDIGKVISKLYARGDSLQNVALGIKKYMKSSYNSVWQVFIQLKDMNELGFAYWPGRYWINYYFFNQKLRQDMAIRMYMYYTQIVE